MGLSDKFTSFSDDEEKGDVVAATSILQQYANDVRNQRVNWQSYLQSQMITQEDYNFIVAFDNAQPDRREAILRDHRLQCARTFMNLLSHISKDQTIQYILALIDDMLQEDKSRVEIFKKFARKNRESAWTAFINLLNRPDGFIINMTSRIISKMARWSLRMDPICTSISPG